MAFKRLAHLIKDLKKEDRGGKIQNIIPTEKERVIKEVIENIFPGAIFKLQLKGQELVISSKNSALKNEFFMKKELILSEMKSRLGAESVNEINFQVF